MYNSRWFLTGNSLLLLVVTGVFLVAGSPAIAASKTAPHSPDAVSVPGSFNSEIGCPGDWQPDCPQAQLVYSADDDVWQGIFDLPANQPITDHYEYKAALNNSWDINYGLHGQQNGPNIPLPPFTQTTSVKFYYDDKSHWITDNQTSVIATAAGDFQSELGCPGDWQPDCLRSWLQDVDGDGTYTFTTSLLPAGDYQVKVALNESWDVNYGAGCQQNGDNIPFNVPNDGAPTTFTYVSSTHCLTVGGAQLGSLATAAAQWVTHDTIAWQVPCAADNMYDLYYDPTASLVLTTTGITGGTAIPLTCDPTGLGAQILARFPQLSGYSALKLPTAIAVDQVKDILKGETAVDAHHSNSNLIDATTLQIAGVLDDIYAPAYNSAIGLQWAGSTPTPTLSLWAPTAQGVVLHLYDDPTTPISTTVPLTLDTDTGIWSAPGNSTWDGKYYTYSVTVFTHYSLVPNTIVTNEVSDPYSLGLSMNGVRSLVVNLNDNITKPQGWDGLVKPALAAPEDISIYELHIRDFSATDPTVPVDHRGTYLAFTDNDSNGMQHLRALAQAGLTHIHILPSFDIASINEDKSTWQSPDFSVLASYPPTSTEQANLIINDANVDPFNWGYDPVHFSTPDGAYATNPNGSTRILEFRDMVKGLSDNGLRTIMDVVYNHTTSSGENSNSVFDEIVPGYYYRLNTLGAVETDSCCQDTATEHMMMDKFVVDSTVTWAKYYKVDGFRFDIMGFQPLANLEHIQTALHSLTLAHDGVDGSKIYLYGEGWNFGDVGNNSRFVQATQANLAGTGIGSFNDRIRDGVRGGGPFNPATDQGFGNGLYTDNTGLTVCGSDNHPCTVAEAKDLLEQEEDWIKLGMAGNLKDYVMVDRNGNTVTGAQLDYKGQPAGYTLDPQEVINYDEAHDDATLFDKNVYAMPVTTTTTLDRARMQNIGVDMVALAQGIPFFHAGQDLMRSKSLDTNSYNSGDWFNRIDWTGQQNTFGSGVPPTAGGLQGLDIDRLSRTDTIKPTASDMALTAAHLQEILAVRKSSNLFRLQTDQEIKDKVSYMNNGPDQVPGLIVQEIDNTQGAPINDEFQRIVTLINASPSTITFTASSLVGLQFTLHLVLAASVDPVVRNSTFDSTTGVFSIPGRTTAVFVQRAACTLSYSDVPPDFWASGYIHWAACAGIATGYPNGTWRPNAPTTRGQIAKMLVVAAHLQINLSGESPFTDVPVGSTFYNYVDTMYNLGIVSGYTMPDGTKSFRPNNSVTRAQLAKMIDITAALPLENPATPTFSDVPRTYWAYQYIETAYAHQIVGGYETNNGLEYRPDMNATRAELAKMLFAAFASPAHPDGGNGPQK